MRRSERRELSERLRELASWVDTARSIRHLGEHLPISQGLSLEASDANLLSTLTRHELQQDWDRASRLAHKLWLPRLEGAVAQESAHRLDALHGAVKSSGNDLRLSFLQTHLAARLMEERRELNRILDDVDRWLRSARLAFAHAEHMPFTRSGVPDPDERAGLNLIIEVAGPRLALAARLLDPGSCEVGVCPPFHAAAWSIAQLYADASLSGSGPAAAAIADRVRRQRIDEQCALVRYRGTAQEWLRRIESIRAAPTSAESFVRSRIAEIAGTSSSATVMGDAVTFLPLQQDAPSQPRDNTLVGFLRLLARDPLDPSSEEFLSSTAKTVGSVLHALKSGFRDDGDCQPGGACQQVHGFIAESYRGAETVNQRLREYVASGSDLAGNLEELLDPALGFGNRVGAPDSSLELLSSAFLGRTHPRLSAILDPEAEADRARRQAHESATRVRDHDVIVELKRIDLDALRRAAPEQRVRIAPLEQHGLHTVWDVLDYYDKSLQEQRQKYADWHKEFGAAFGADFHRFWESDPFLELDGMGETSAIAVRQASLRIQQAVRDDMPVRIHVKSRAAHTEALLRDLHRWDRARRFKPTEDESAVAKTLDDLLGAVALDGVMAMRSAAPEGAAGTLEDLIESALGRSSVGPEPEDFWQDFLSRPADYFGMLTELGFTTEDEAKMHGDLPEEILDAIRAKELKRDHLSASLRAYQGFGARFVLTQEKVVIGDEMGLGKTVEALAVFAHLHSSGWSHFLVVCPAALVTNWVRETTRHTSLKAVRLHGTQFERELAIKSWLRTGGVGVITYDLLPWSRPFLDRVELSCVVFDEAHYIKNPLAKRSIAASRLMSTLRYVMMLTGTPLENDVQEFQNLVSYIRPDLAWSAPTFPPSRFRVHMAPAYLRRNQEDVLTELPELIEVDEWVGLSKTDEDSYWSAVDEGNFMKMRRVAMLASDSSKLARLKEIVDEARANGRSVIVFSYFREVLDNVVHSLSGEVFGPLTGATPAGDRQRLVDRFTAAPHGAVLVAQITVGGVGLNVQSASVVVLCEPQLKPTTESQAIARAHRMGQTSSVQVHRLLTEGGVDERIREILADKRRRFDDFVRVSALAERAPDAVDMSDAEIAHLVVAAERERLNSRAADS